MTSRPTSWRVRTSGDLARTRRIAPAATVTWGLSALRGPGIMPKARVKGGHVMDVAPTILELLGVPVPDYIDGKPLNLDAAKIES